MKNKIALDPPRIENNQFVEGFSNCLRKRGFEIADGSYWDFGLRDCRCLIIHWPRVFMGGAGRRKAIPRLYRLKILKALFGFKIVWVAHNAVDHDKDGLSPIWKDFTSIIDGVIYLSKSSKRIIELESPQLENKKYVVVPHGIYHFDKMPALRNSSSNSKRLINFGLIRPYKGLEVLIKAMENVEPSSVELMICGKIFDEDHAENLKKMASETSNVKCVFFERGLTESELNDYIDSADGVVLPYRNILNSGSAIHSLSRYRPVLVPAKGSMPELQEQVGREWVHLFDGEIISSDLSRFCKSIPKNNKRPNLADFEWDKIGANIETFINSLN